jgi:hypothetical protein
MRNSSPRAEWLRSHIGRLARGLAHEKGTNDVETLADSVVEQVSVCVCRSVSAYAGQSMCMYVLRTL